MIKQLTFKANSDNKEDKVENIYDSAVYARESEANYLLGLYHLVL